MRMPETKKQSLREMTEQLAAEHGIELPKVLRLNDVIHIAEVAGYELQFKFTDKGSDNEVGS